MRGVALEVGEEEIARWCPLVYEYLPDFCYTCGLIGHVDKLCEKKLQKGEVQQFGKHLRFILEKRRVDEFAGERPKRTRRSGPWKSNSGGSHGSFGGSGSRLWSGGSGSNALTWRK